MNVRRQVITPNIYNFELWKTSGHAAHYKDNMFAFNIEKEEFGLKPMVRSSSHCCASFFVLTTALHRVFPQSMK